MVRQEVDSDFLVCLVSMLATSPKICYLLNYVVLVKLFSQEMTWALNRPLILENFWSTLESSLHNCDNE